MSKSIRISDELAAVAEASAIEAHRSPPQQIEHWAQIGRVLESALSYPAEIAVKRAGRPQLDAVLDSIDSEDGMRRTQKVIRRRSGKIVSTDR